MFCLTYIFFLPSFCTFLSTRALHVYWSHRRYRVQLFSFSTFFDSMSLLDSSTYLLGYLEVLCIKCWLHRRCHLTHSYGDFLHLCCDGSILCFCHNRHSASGWRAVSFFVTLFTENACASAHSQRNTNSSLGIQLPIII